MIRPACPCDFCDAFEEEACVFADASIPDDILAADCIAYKTWLEDMDAWRELQQDIYDPPRFSD